MTMHSLDSMLDRYLALLVETKIREFLDDHTSNQNMPFNIGEVVPLRKAASLLGYSSSRPLYHDIEEGLLRVGHEIEDRRRPGSRSPRYFVNVPAARRRLALVPEARNP